MKYINAKSLAIILMMLIGKVFVTNAQNCNNIILNDDFSSATNWVSVGNGGVNISNGTCNFNNVSGGDYNKVLRN
jgi:hypothetical protein